MWRLFLLIKIALLFVYCSSSRSINRQCGRFKDGTFSSHVEGVNKFLTVFRTDTLQLEVVNGDADTLKLKVRWLDPCTYELVFLNTEFKGQKILSKITETQKDFYIYFAQLEGQDPISDTMFLVRNR